MGLGAGGRRGGGQMEDGPDRGPIEAATEGEGKSAVFSLFSWRIERDTCAAADVFDGCNSEKVGHVKSLGD